MNQNKLFVPGAIILAALIIGGAIMFSNRDGSSHQAMVGDNNEEVEFSINPIDSERDHIMGNPDADIVIVEYSDFECPFCARFHPTMERIMDEYGSQGKVAWVYRHFPLNSHRRAQITAEASVCVAELGGNDAFWSFSKKVFGTREEAIIEQNRDLLEESLTDESLREFAVDSGIDGASYDSCLASGKHRDRVREDYNDGLSIAQNDSNFGTPYSIVLSKNGIETTIAGAQPYSVVKQIVDTVLGQ